MGSDNSKIFLWAYYGGLLAGVLLMNYAFFHQQDFVEELMNQFSVLDKFQLISKQEFFFYVLLMRAKQLAFLFLCYLFFPKYLLLILLDFYVAFCLGGFLSMEAYYGGFRGILCGACFFFPHFLCYGMIYYVACRQAATRREKLFANDKKALVCAILLCLLGCVLETYINSSIMEVLSKRA